MVPMTVWLRPEAVRAGSYSIRGRQPSEPNTTEVATPWRRWRYAHYVLAGPSLGPARLIMRLPYLELISLFAFESAGPPP